MITHEKAKTAKKIKRLKEFYGNPDRCRMPKSNIEYWHNKIKRNIERDREVTETLQNQGWIVLRFWEETIKSNLDNCIDTILETIGRKERQSNEN